MGCDAVYRALYAELIVNLPSVVHRQMTWSEESLSCQLLI
jgi:hypothetical protein